MKRTRLVLSTLPNQQETLTAHMARLMANWVELASGVEACLDLQGDEVLMWTVCVRHPMESADSPCLLANLEICILGSASRAVTELIEFGGPLQDCLIAQTRLEECFVFLDGYGRKFGQKFDAMMLASKILEEVMTPSKSGS